MEPKFNWLRIERDAKELCLRLFLNESPHIDGPNPYSLATSQFKNNKATALDSWLKETFGKLEDFLPGYENTRLDTIRISKDPITNRDGHDYDIIKNYIKDHIKSDDADPVIKEAQQKLIKAIVPYSETFFRGDELELALSAKALAQMVKKGQIQIEPGDARNASEVALEMLRDAFRDLQEWSSKEVMRNASNFLEKEFPSPSRGVG